MCATDDKKRKFKSAQESARKDIERAFGVLKQRWHILHNPTCGWHLNKLRNIMYTCIILHNMILEDEDNSISVDDEIEDDLVADKSKHKLVTKNARQMFKKCKVGLNIIC